MVVDGGEGGNIENGRAVMVIPPGAVLLLWLCRAILLRLLQLIAFRCHLAVRLFLLRLLLWLLSLRRL